MEHPPLKVWMEANSQRLCSSGYALGFIEYEQGQTAVDLDSSEFIGRITCWKNGQCEVHFLSSRSGADLFIIPEIGLEGDTMIRALEDHGVL